MIIEKLKIGDKVKKVLSNVDTKDPYEGTVIWIHPKKRFYRVEFVMSDGQKLRESYFD